MGWFRGESSTAPARLPSDVTPEELAEVSKRAEAGLRYLMIEEARRRCKDMFEAYAACTNNTFFLAIPFTCQPDLNKLNKCLEQHTTDAVLESYKRRWIAAGRPENFRDDVTP